MKLTREYLTELMTLGATADDLMSGIEIDDVVGFTRKIRVIRKRDIKNLNFARAKGTLNANKKCNTILTERVILQRIGGGPLKQGEYLQVNQLPNSDKFVITGSRGIHSIKFNPPK